MTFNPNLVGTPPLSRATAKVLDNNTGVSVSKGTPVRLTAAGMELLDVAVESSIDSIAGVARVDISNGANGEIVAAGSVEDISTPFSIGDPVYVSKTGGLTNSKPSIGVGGFVAGDFIVRVGVIAKNVGNPLLKDLLINIQIMGQL